MNVNPDEMKSQYFFKGLVDGIGMALNYSIQCWFCLCFTYNSSIEQKIGRWDFDLRFVHGWNITVVEMIPLAVINQLQEHI